MLLLANACVKVQSGLQGLFYKDLWLGLEILLRNYQYPYNLTRDKHYSVSMDVITIWMGILMVFSQLFIGFGGGFYVLIKKSGATSQVSTIWNSIKNHNRGEKDVRVGK